MEDFIARFTLALLTLNKAIFNAVEVDQQSGLLW